jgi:hypothetical protein
VDGVLSAAFFLPWQHIVVNDIFLFKFLAGIYVLSQVTVCGWIRDYSVRPVSVVK